MALQKLIECHDEGELSFIKSLLDGSGIMYVVHNEHFGSLYPGPVMPFNTRVIMTDEMDIARAQTLLSRLSGPYEVDEAS